MAQAKKPMIVVGSNLLQRSDAGAVFSLASQLAQKVSQQNGVKQDWKVLNVLHRVNLL